MRQFTLGQLNKTINYLGKADQFFKYNKNIRIKLTGNGTSISHSMHCVVIAFSIIREGTNPNSPGGNHTVAILNTTEDHDYLAESLKEVTGEIKDFKKHSVRWY